MRYLIGFALAASLGHCASACAQSLAIPRYDAAAYCAAFTAKYGEDALSCVADEGRAARFSSSAWRYVEDSVKTRCVMQAKDDLGLAICLEGWSTNLSSKGMTFSKPVN